MIAPDLAGLVRPIGSLREDPGNARMHSDRNVSAIAESLRTFGQRKPVVALLDGTVVAGNGTLRAARALGWPELAVATFENEAQAKAYAMADNQTGALATWDDALLARTLEGLSDELRGAVGFTAGEIGRLLAAVAAPADETIPELPEHAETQSGDVYVLGRHRLTCGDATDRVDVARALAGAAPFQMVTDPPYGVDYDPAWRQAEGLNDSERMGRVLNDDRVDWSLAYALFTGDVAYVWHAGIFAGAVGAHLVGSGFDIRAQLIWSKPRFAISRGAYHWGHEPAWYAVRRGASARWTGDRAQSTVWEIGTHDGTGETEHGTQKPVECMERPMRNHGAPGDVVYDPFLGSGTSIIAAERADRAARGLELDPRWCDVIVQRWEALSGHKAERLRG